MELLLTINSLESSVLSEFLSLMAEAPEAYKQKTVAAYLQGLAGVRRFSALAMFLSSNDKQLVKNLLSHCRHEGCSEADLARLAELYEL
ncbi:putative monad-binding region of RPAP3 domain-containing protein [Phthorimaea operculella]|nr:putative monad-binding region of RPAP3 domain-containing protein [Phthorimaea operculella]